MSDDKKNQLAILEQVSTQEIFTKPVESLTGEQAALAWSVVDFFEAFSKGRKTELRERLLKTAETIGEKNEKGSFTATLSDGTRVIKEKRQSKVPDSQVVKDVLRESGLSVEDAFTPKQSWVLDQSKLDFLIEGGKVPEAPIERSMRERDTFALKVKPNKETAGKIKEAKELLIPAKK